MLPTSLRLGSRSKLVFVDPPRARCSASRSAGDGANARMASPEKKPGVLLLVAVVVVVALPLALSLLLLAAPDTGQSDVEGLRASNAGVVRTPNNGLAEKLKTLASGLSPRRDSVPSTVERLSLSGLRHHRVRASCWCIASMGGGAGSELARDHTPGTSIGSEVIRWRGSGRIPNGSDESMGPSSTRGNT